MPIAASIQNALGSSSMIRRMFEEGNRLKKIHGPDNVFDFSIGNPDLEPPPAFHQALVRLAAEDAPGSHGYMSNAGFPEVREALAKKASAEQGVTLDGSCLVMSVGAAGGLTTVFKTILNPGDKVIVSRPFFMEYRAYTANHGGSLTEVDSLPGFNLDVGAIEKALTPDTAAVLINSPHNPTGRIYPAETIAALAAVLEAHGKKTGRYPYLVSDEPYRELAYGTTVPPVLAAYRESIVVSSYSKSLSLPGERIGYIAVNPDIADKEDVMNGLIYATRVLGFVNAPALMQRIVAELTGEKVDIGVYGRRRGAFKEVMDAAGIGYAEPEGAFYLFCRVPERKHGAGPAANAGDAAFVGRLKDYLILGVPGSSFGAPGWLRFAYCVDEKLIRSSLPAFQKAMAVW